MMSRQAYYAVVTATFLFVSAAGAFPTDDPNATGGPRHGSAPAPATPVGKITKSGASDGKTVAEVVSGRDELKGRTVTIHGKVVKASTAILGKNWLHLQDGSGSADKATHDIVVTTTDKVVVGDVVNASGKVQTNVDLGSGYKYAVLIDGAKVSK
jgi:hypothetical protein